MYGYFTMFSKCYLLQFILLHEKTNEVEDKLQIKVMFSELYNFVDKTLLSTCTSIKEQVYIRKQQMLNYDHRFYYPIINVELFR